MSLGQDASATETSSRCWGLWSADFDEPTGQAIVTKRVAERVLPSFGAHRSYVFHRRGKRGWVRRWLAVTFRMYGDVLAGRVGKLYVVASRSAGGFIRDVPALATALLGVRVVVHVHGSDVLDLLGHRWVSPMARGLYRRAEVLVPSGHLLAPLAEVFGLAVRLCENFGIGCEGGADVPTGSDFRIVWNSNVMASKGVLDFLSGLALAQQRKAGVVCEVLGEMRGDAEMSYREIQRAFVRASMRAQVTYHGPVPPEAVPSFVQGGHAVALASSVECQPLAVIQGMCAGRALIVTDTDAIRATVGEYPAEFVPAGDPEAIADAILRLEREWTADPAAFFERRRTASEKATSRFGTDRFDREMRGMLGEPRIPVQEA